MRTTPAAFMAFFNNAHSAAVKPSDEGVEIGEKLGPVLVKLEGRRLKHPPIFCW